MMPRLIIIFLIFHLGACASTYNTPASDEPMAPKSIDHLVYVVDDLEVGRDRMEQLLGVRPVMGGRHPQYGTHNALLSLGPNTYLEVIAPDPSIKAPNRGVLFGADHASEPRLATWALRRESIDEAFDYASSLGVNLGTIEAGSRTKPDGTVISWRLSDPYMMSLDGAVPFLISWGSTTHPASVLPSAGDLIGLSIEHPNPQHVIKALNALRIDIDVKKGNKFQMIARVKTPKGVVEIR